MVDWKTVLQEFVAELTGIFILLFVGFSGCCLPFVIPMQTRLKHDDCGAVPCNGSDPVFITKGTPIHDMHFGNLFALVIAFSFGSGICGAILIAGHITGGHFNPGVTIAMASIGKVPWIKVTYYLPAQYLGAFLSAMAIHVFYLPYIDDDMNDVFLKKSLVLEPNPTANLWITTLDGFLSGWVFMMIILAVGNKANAVPGHIQPVYIIMCFIGILIAFLGNAGSALNPARDLGPKIYASLFIGIEEALGALSYHFWWLSQQLAITLGFVAGGWTHHGIFEFITPPQKQPKH